MQVQIQKGSLLRQFKLELPEIPWHNRGRKHLGTGRCFGGRQIWVCLKTALLTSSVVYGRSLSLLEFQYFHLSNWDACMLSCSVVSDSLQPHGGQSTGLLCPWDFPGKDTGVGCHLDNKAPNNTQFIQFARVTIRSYRQNV